MRRGAKKVLIGIAGGIVLALGIAMIVLPGPAFLVIPAGLAILASEFEWAQRLFQKFEAKFKHWKEQRARRKNRNRPVEA